MTSLLTSSRRFVALAAAGALALVGCDLAPDGGDAEIGQTHSAVVVSAVQSGDFADLQPWGHGTMPQRDSDAFACLA